MQVSTTLTLIAFVACLTGCFCDYWQEWWTYDGISGPSFWGLMNPKWNMCSRGRRQSPINIEPSKLLFDPSLRRLHVDKEKVSGYFFNTGQSLLFTANTLKNPEIYVNISGGPLAYHYQFHEILIHYGNENYRGSEHRINGYSFPGEIQIFGFNKDLYHNMSEAKYKSQGIVGISLMIQVGEEPQKELRLLSSFFSRVAYRGSYTSIPNLSIKSLLPDTDQFMTYDGSLTYPGCWETVTWIIMNKPIYITKQELYALRKLRQGSQDTPKAPLGNNIRPVQPLNYRTVRTNIKIDDSNIKGCLPTGYGIYYKANDWNTEDEQNDEQKFIRRI